MQLQPVPRRKRPDTISVAAGFPPDARMHAQGPPLGCDLAQTEEPGPPRWRRLQRRFRVRRAVGGWIRPRCAQRSRPARLRPARIAENFVDAIPQFGGRRERARPGWLRPRATAAPVALTAQVGGHHDGAGRESTVRPRPFGEASVFENLQKDEQHLAMCLFNLVEKHHRGGRRRIDR